MSGQGDERRASVRHACAMEGTCRALLPDTEPLWTAKVLDISRQGISLLLSPDLLPGTKLLVTVRDKDRRARVLEARVVFSRPHASGKWMPGCELLDALTETEAAALAGLSPEGAAAR
jgi:hypothetical protein